MPSLAPACIVCEVEVHLPESRVQGFDKRSQCASQERNAFRGIRGNPLGEVLSKDSHGQAGQQSGHADRETQRHDGRN